MTRPQRHDRSRDQFRSFAHRVRRPSPPCVRCGGTGRITWAGRKEICPICHGPGSGAIGLRPPDRHGPVPKGIVATVELAITTATW